MKHCSLIIAVLTALTCFSCSSNKVSDDSEILVQTLVAQMPSFDDESFSVNTKTLISVSPEDQISYSWAVGDILGVYPTNGNQISFELTESSISEDGSKANFDGGDWALKSNRTYYSYFPFSREAYSSFAPSTNIPVSYLQQKQVAFNNTEDAGHHDYLAAGAHTTNESGVLFFTFNRLGALLRIKFILPADGTYQNLVLSTDDSVIPVAGHVDLTTETISYIPDTYSSSLAINLNNATGSLGDAAYVYLMLPPMSLKSLGKQLSASLYYNDGTVSNYSLCTTGSTTVNTPDFKANVRYKRDAVLVEDPNGLNTEDFGHSEGNW